MTLRHRVLSASLGVIAALVSAFVFGEPPATPTPTPTPSSRTRLSDYAQWHKLQREQQGGPTTIVISDDNLKELASRTELTAVTQQSAIPQTPVGTNASINPRAYWRERVQQQLTATRWLENQVKANRIEIVNLWDLFYACDVPDDRESEIRPRLIRKIEDQKILDREFDAANSAFQTLMNEARRSGARAGWFRDLLNQPAEAIPED